MESLRPKLTDEFLSTLVETARRYGWRGDYYEIDDFVTSVFRLARKDPPNIEPYESTHDGIVPEPWF